MIMADYETVAKNERARLDASIPLNLRLPPDLVAALPKDVSEVPETCGLLTEEQIRITRVDGTALAQEIASGKITAVDAVTAVASRAAIAEQLVRRARLGFDIHMHVAKIHVEISSLAGLFAYRGVLSRHVEPDTRSLHFPWLHTGLTEHYSRG